MKNGGFMKQWRQEILAKEGYEAFHKTIDGILGKKYFGIEKSADWDEASAEVKAAWRHAMVKVIERYEILPGDE
jgi:hypothetical protein